MRLRFRNNIATVIIVLMMFFAFNLSGVGTVRSATRMGYVKNESHSNWSASYTLLDGTMRRTVYPSKPAEPIHVEVVTSNGSISIEMRDTDGNTIFAEDNIGTASFDVEVSGKVVVHIVADHHKGSFQISG